MCEIYTALQMFLVQFSTHQLLCFMVKRSERTQIPRRESWGEKAPRADGLAVNQELGRVFCYSQVKEKKKHADSEIRT